ncbi:MAG: hypothetical protein ACO23O_06580, partial [Ilumatobacteraceae bacterium]
MPFVWSNAGERSRPGGRRVVRAVGLLVGVVTLGAVGVSTIGSAADVDPLTSAWERAAASGSYRFSSDAEQVTTPVASVVNVGRGSSVEHLHVDGVVAPVDGRVDLDVWGSASNNVVADPDVEIRIDEDGTLQRVAGGDWEPAPGAAAMLAPGGDVLAYLGAARDVVEVGQRSVGSVRFTVYSFELDGPTFAVRMAEDTEELLRRRGELAPGSRVQPSSFHRDTTGTGELWVGADGLPVRQLLSLQFPEDADGAVSATISVDFFDFTAADSGLWGLGDVDVSALLVLSLVLGGVFGMVRFVDRLGVPRRAIATAVAAAVFVPVAVGEVTATASSSRDAGGPLSDAPTAQLSPGDVAGVFDALVSDPTVSLQDGLAEPAVSTFEGPDPGTDTDGDGLTDFVERRIGTAWENEGDDDTDGDGISDRVEVEGFELDGQWWYSDPLLVDSNLDGISDGLEYDVDGNGFPNDLDGDGVPDVFDDDNDGDGVPDGDDISAFVALPADGGSYTADLPFEFSVANSNSNGDTPIASGLPLFVDIQIRPAISNHLQYALNPFDVGDAGMDWPSDGQGQIQDLNDSPNDIKLVPMLEIAVESPEHELPPTEVLSAYLASVTTGDESSGRRTMYVPLQLVIDDDTGARVAFAARIPYLSQDDWGPAHSMRLVWAVQVATDQPCAPAEDGSADSECVPVFDTVQIAHRYYEDWTIAGLTVSQEHGAETALIHEDPSVDDDISDHTPSYALSYVLSERFLNSVESSPGQFSHEITIENMVDLFDHSVRTGTAAYELPNVFSVHRGSAATFDEAVRDLGVSGPLGSGSVSAVAGLLDGVFTSQWTGPDSFRPLVLSAYTNTVRSVGLDALALGGSTVALAGTGVAFDFDPDGAPVETDTLGGMKWSSYCGGDGATPIWSQCDSEQISVHLSEQYGAIDFDDDSSAPIVVEECLGDQAVCDDVSRTQNFAMQIYTLLMAQGLTQLIVSEVNGQVTIPHVDNDDTTDLPAQMRDFFDDYGSGGSAGVKFLSNLFIKAKFPPWDLMKTIDDRGPLSTSIGYVKEIKNLFNKNTRSVKGVLGVGVLVMVVVVLTLLALSLTGDETAEVLLSSVLFLGQLAFGVVWPMYAANLVRATTSLSLLSVLGSSSNLIGFTRTANAIGAVVTIVIAWGFFIYGVVSGGVSFYSAEFNRALAGTIATTIFAVFMFALAGSIVGLIIIGIIAVVDALLYLLCKYADVDLESPLVDNSCFSVSGFVIKGLTAAVYGYEVMVDAEADDLVETGDVDVSLRDESLGYQVGNVVDIALPVTTNVRHQAPSPETWQLIPYLWFYTKGNLRSSTMEYTLKTFEEDLDSEWDSMPNVWAAPTVHDEYLDKDLYETSTFETLTAELSFDTPGINRVFDVYLNYGYAFPAAECWTVPNPFGIPPFIPVCYKRSFSDNDSSAFDPRVYDVFPATLDEFVALAGRPGGAWGLAWDDAFAALPDADFDGLLSSAFGGLDPDDRSWDTDGDGLSDAFEIEQRAEGQALSLNSDDIDLDGLTDAQELRLGTNPGVSDTDNDGLSDGEEVRHLDESGLAPVWDGGWDVTVYTDIVDGDDGWEVRPSAGDVTVVVSSDPLSADGDGDGIGDQAERQLAQSANAADRIDANGVPYHPNVANASPFGLVLSTDDPDGFVRPGQSFTVRADAVASAALAPGVVGFDVPDRLGGPVDPAVLGFDPDTFDGVQSVSVESALTVAADAASGPAEISADGTVRLPGGEPQSPVWAINNEPGRQGVGTYSWVDLIAPDDASSDDFVISEMASDITEAGGAGDVRLVPWPNGTPATLDQDTFTYDAFNEAGEFWKYGETQPSYLRGENAADTACTSAGDCLTVWDHYDNCTTVTIN